MRNVVQWPIHQIVFARWIMKAIHSSVVIQFCKLNQHLDQHHVFHHPVAALLNAESKTVSVLVRVYLITMGTLTRVVGLNVCTIPIVRRTELASGANVKTRARVPAAKMLFANQ